MLVDVRTFQGEIPIMDPHQLPAGAAVRAINSRFENGTLSPVRGDRFVTDLLSPRQTLYLRASGTWLAYDSLVSVVPGPIAEDRTYIAGDGPPRFEVQNGTEYALALPAPASGPTVATLTAVDETLIETVLYAYTYVTVLDEEGPPSPLSAPLNWSPGVPVRVSGFAAPPTGRGINRIRIYRSQTGTTGATDLYYADEITVATTSYDHDNSLAPAETPITTMEYDTPPDDLEGFIALPNGILAGWRGRELLFSEPYLPHAWPASYVLKVDYDIVGLAAFGTQLAVMTKGQPYRAQGTHPSSFVLERLEENLPCLSRAGIVDFGYAAAYPSTEGVVVITGTGADVATRNLFSRDQWRAMQPETFIAGQRDGRYLFRCDGPIPHGAGNVAIINLESQVQPFLIRSDMTPTCFYHDLRSGHLYYQDAGDNRLYIWDDSREPRIAQEWESGKLDLTYPASFAAAEVEGTPGTSMALNVYADGVLLHTIHDMNKPVRLPHKTSEDWHLRMVTDGTIRAIKIATSMSELGRAPS